MSALTEIPPIAPIPPTTSPECVEVRAEVEENANVQNLHASIMREHNEPRDGFEPIPFWLTVFFAMLLGWGGWYMGRVSGDLGTLLDGLYFGYSKPTDAKAAWRDFTDPDKIILDNNARVQVGSAGAVKKELSPRELGSKIYSRCAGCHNADGGGQRANNIPPLDGSEWVIGENPEDIARLTRILLNGLTGPITVKGVVYNGAQMPAWGQQLKDKEIAGVLTYIRSNWSNKASEIPEAAVAAARAAAGNRGPWTAAELLAITTGDAFSAAPAAAPMGAAPMGATPAAAPMGAAPAAATPKK